MNHRSFFVLIFLFLISKNCFAQSSELEKYETALSSIVILKNENDHLPLKKVNQKIAYVFFGKNKNHNFLNALKKYTTIDEISFNQILENSTITNYDLLISAVDSREAAAFLERKLREQEQLIPPICLALFFPKEELPKESLAPESSIFNSIILASSTNSWTESLIAQAIFGGAMLENLKGKNIQRLGYAPPELVGMDSEFLNQKIDSIAQNSLDSAAFPGVQVLVAKNGKVVFHKTYGYHTYEKKRPVLTTDIYDFASVTKVTTALAALMKLHGEGKFDLDAPLKTYFSKYKFYKSNKANLSLRAILAHQAQLQPWIPYWRSTIKKNGKFKPRTFKKFSNKNYNIKITDNLFLHKKYQTKRIYKAIRKSPLQEKKEYRYSGLAFYIFPEMVSDLTGKNYEEYLQQTFYKPLGAMTLTYNPLRKFPKEKIIPTERDTFFRQVQIHGTVHDEGAIMMGGISANAGLFGSANDLAKLAQMYLNEGIFGGEKFIEAASVREFTKVQFPELPNRRGLGFDKPLLEYDEAASSVAKDASPASYGHSGYTGTFFWVDPEENLIYIFFSNRVFPTRLNRKIYQMNIRPQIHQVIYDSFNKNVTD